MLSSLRERLGRVSERWGIPTILPHRSRDGISWESLEELLLAGDVGISMTERIIDSLHAKAAVRGANVDEVSLLSTVLREIISEVKGTGEPIYFSSAPTVVMLIGVNGSGKTTTAAKLAWNLGLEDRKTILAAADTFRAGAIEQLRVWGEKAGVRVVSHPSGGDPGAVVFDAIKAAEARGYDCLIVDTAGRLHNRSNLMEEMARISGIIEKNCAGWVRESFLVIDAVTGQNGLRQVEAFGKVIPVTGLVMTKYDHTAKGGVILSAGHELGVPVRYVGLGEGLEDLVPFNPDEFVEALLKNPGREE